MSLVKEPLKTKPLSKVKFTIPKETALNHEKAYLVGEFNNWDPKSGEMKKNKRDNSFSITLKLDRGRDYQFRYLLDDNIWINDDSADNYVRNPFGNADNSVVSVK